MMNPRPPRVSVFRSFPDSNATGTGTARFLRRSPLRLGPPPALLLALVLALALVFPGAEPARAGQVDLPVPLSAPQEGMAVRVLPDGNIAVLDPGYSIPGPQPVMNVGAVYLFDGATLQSLGVLTGAAAGDRVGFRGITVLPNGAFLIRSPQWSNGAVEQAGAVTWCGPGRPLPAKISSDNSLVGEHSQDAVGTAAIEVLSNGNYVVGNPVWNNGTAIDAGAVTFGNKDTGVSGPVSAANSLVGVSANDGIGRITQLTNGNYVVSSIEWDNGEAKDAGAVTWCSGTEGRTGPVSAANSLVGSHTIDLVGGGHFSGNPTIIPLADGNYVVASAFWDNGAAADAGAVTWCSGTEGRAGLVSAANSLVGSHGGDQVGRGTPPVVPLDNASYVVLSPHWSNSQGAVTWGRPAGGVAGVVSEENSLVRTGSGISVTKGLAGGHYAIACPMWNEGRGAVAWAGDGAGLTGEISGANSLVGREGDYAGGGGITVLGDGNYVVRSYGGSAGVVTWGSGAAGVTGVISELNSLMGSQLLDGVGREIVPLDDRHYLVVSPSWNGNRGAVTWCAGASGVRGMVSADNSLTGSNLEDAVGDYGITMLANGNYVVNSHAWNEHGSAVTWGAGDKGVAGPVSSSNSLIGPRPVAGSLDFMIGSQVIPLTNGNFVVSNPYRGTVTWCSGTEGRTGAISPVNSLMNDNPNDGVGTGGVTALANGHYVVASHFWSSYRGAVTWCSGTQGRTGYVTERNSLTGSRPLDRVGGEGVIALPNGNYLVVSTDWNDSRGAVTWGDGAVGLTGAVSSANSLTGAREQDRAGKDWTSPSPGITLLTNGNYVVYSSWWDGSRGAVTWGSGTTGVRGEISEANSLTGLGVQGYTGLRISALEDGGYLMDGTRSAAFLNRLLLGDGRSGTHGTVTDNNSVAFPMNADPHPEDWVTYYDAANSRLLAAHMATGQLSLLGYVPEMAVRSGAWTGTNAGTPPVPHGQTVPDVKNGTDFGGAATARDSVERTFTILNTGMEPLHLTGTPPVTVEGPDAADFTVSVSALPASGTVTAAGGAAEFRITFKPSAPGLRKAVVRIPNDDRDESGYQFAIQGMGVDPDGGGGNMVFTAWRAQYFGNAAAGTGHLDDFDSDGVVNLLEFAFGTHPAGGRSGDGEGGDGGGGGEGVNSGQDALRYSGSLTAGGGTLAATGQPVLARLEDGAITALFIRRKDRAQAGLDYTPQFTPDPAAAAWTAITATPKMLAEDGLYEVVSVPFPAPVPPAAGAAGFFRVRLEAGGDGDFPR